MKKLLALIAIVTITSCKVEPERNNPPVWSSPTISQDSTAYTDQVEQIMAHPKELMFVTGEDEIGAMHSKGWTVQHAGWYWDDPNGEYKIKAIMVKY